MRNTTHRLLKPLKRLALANHKKNKLFAPVFFMLVLTTCTSEQSSYFPLEPFRWWDYQETLSIRDEQQIRRRFISNSSPVTIEGNMYYVQESQGFQRQLYQVRKEGFFQLTDQGAQLILPLDAEIGGQWTLPSRLGVIESRTFAREDRILTFPRAISMSYKVIDLNDTVKVKAGRFINCLKVEGQAKTTVPIDRHNGQAEVIIKSIDWYAPGVGLIKSERIEQSDSTFLKTGYYSLELLETGK